MTNQGWIQAYKIGLEPVELVSACVSVTISAKAKQK